MGFKLPRENFWSRILGLHLYHLILSPMQKKSSLIQLRILLHVRLFASNSSLFTTGLTSTGASPPPPKKVATIQGVWWPNSWHPGWRSLVRKVMLVVVFHFALGSEMLDLHFILCETRPSNSSTHCILQHMPPNSLF